MNRLRHLLLVLAALLALSPLAAFAASNPEIEALIVRVEHAQGVVFIRNGSEHSAVEAGAHLRRKLAAAHGRITTAEQFIDNIGTRSSMTGIAYRVRVADGRESTARPGCGNYCVNCAPNASDRFGRRHRSSPCQGPQGDKQHATEHHRAADPQLGTRMVAVEQQAQHHRQHRCQ
jgi:hypothetical protein